MARPDRPSRTPAPVTPPPAVSKFWIGVAVASLAANAVLAWQWNAARQRESAAREEASRLLAKPADVSVPPALAAYAALGSYLADNNHIGDLNWTEDQFRAFEQGVRAAYKGRSLPLDEKALKLRDEVSAQVQAKLGQSSGAPATGENPIETYFRTLREKEKVQQTNSGLHYRVTDEGTGPTPTSDSTVVLSYGARLPDGKSLPQLSRQRAKVAVNDLLPGMAEGILLLKGGSKALFYLPPALSFKEGSWPAGVSRGAPIIFFVELHDVLPE